MKRLLSIATAMIMTINPASGSENTMKPTVTVAPQLIATPNARVHVKRIVKSKIVNTKVLRFIAIDDNDDFFVQDDDLATGYRRRDLIKIEHPEGISEQVRWRLFLARQLALLKFREVHSG